MLEISKKRSVKNDKATVGNLMLPNEDAVWKLLTQTSIGSDKIIGSRVSITKSKIKSIYAIEYMIAETLATEQPMRRWAITGVGKDGGIDFEARGPNSGIELLGLKIEPYVIGQIKRMRTFSESKISDALRKINIICSTNNVHFAIIAISTDTKSPDQCRNYIEERKRDSFNFPRYFLDIDNIIYIWSRNLLFLRGMLSRCFPEKNALLIEEYILERSRRRHAQERLSLSAVPGCREVVQKTPFQITVRAEFQKFLDLHTIILRYEPDASAPGKISAMPPSDLVKSGLRVQVRDSSSATLRIWLRAEHAGDLALGRLIAYEAGNPGQTVAVDLGRVTAAPRFVPGYFTDPYEKQAGHLRRLRGGAAGGATAAVFVGGAGGAGKTALCQTIVDDAVEDGFRPIRIEVSDTSDNRSDICALLHALHGPHKHIGPPTAANILDAVRPFLGSNGEAVLPHLAACLGGSEVELRPRDIAICACALAVRAMQDQPLIIHVSDMHWASRPLIDVLSLLVNALTDAETKVFGRGVFFLFEGRTGEARRIEDGKVNIQPWLDFQQSTRFEQVVLTPWSQEHSRTFAERLLDPTGVQQILLHKSLVDYIVGRGSGSPMHIIEQIRMLLDEGVLRLTGDGRLDVHKALRGERPIPGNVHEVIRDRMQFLETRQPELAELLILLAKTGRRNSRSYVEHLMVGLSYKIGTFDLEATGCIRAPHDSQPHIEFVHENYVDVLKEFAIDGRSPLLKRAIGWHEEAARTTDAQALSLAKLLYLQSNPPYGCIIKTLLPPIVVARRTRNGTELNHLLRCLLRVPHDDLIAAKLDRDALQYELALVLAGTRSWSDSLKELDQLLLTCADRPGDRKAHIWLVEALAEKANLCTDLQRTEMAVRSADEGLERLYALLGRQDDDATQQQLYRLHDKLLHRKAVALWFDGCRSEAMYLQREAWRQARQRRDEASLAIIVREYGTLSLHGKPRRGLALLSIAARISRENSDIPKLDRRVTEVQEVMAQLVVQHQFGTPGPVYKQLVSNALQLRDETLAEGMGYEPTLAALVAGVAAIAGGDVKTAHTLFRVAMIEATQSQLPNLMWQSRINLAQTYLSLGQEDEARLSADAAGFIIMQGFDLGHPSANRRALMERPLRQVLRCGGSIHPAHILSGGDLPESDIAPLLCRVGEAEYFLMN